MNIHRRIATSLLLACALLFHTPAQAQLQVVGDGGPGPVKAQHLTAELVSASPNIAPGGTVQAGLVITLEEHWHVYWINAGAFGEALNLIPKPLPPDAKLTVTGGQTDFVLTLTTGKRETHAEFYPFDQDQIANAAPQPIESRADGVRLRVRRSEDLKTLPATLHGVLKLSDEIAYEFTAPVVPGEIAPAPSSSSPVAASSSVTTLTAIGLAFLGGIILNLMPCVFPVLFLKGLALLQSSGQQRKHLRSHGLVYTLGILVSFWIIVAVLLALRAGGSQAGWGFQLQSPIL